MRTALTIAGSDSIGGAGIQADLKAFASLGVHGCSAITCITAQNTSGIQQTIPVPGDMLRNQLEAILDDVTPESAKTGAIFTGENGKVIADIFGNRKIPLVVDPVLAATTGASLAREDLISVLKKELVPICALITPNRSEAEALTGVRVDDINQAGKAAELLLSLGASGVLIKGIREEERISDFLIAADGSTRVLSSTYVEGAFHGTGCILSALIAGLLSMGEDICTSVIKARGMLFSAIEGARTIGKGLKIIDPIESLLIAAEKGEILDKLTRIAQTIAVELDARLIPEVGSNLCFSLPSPTEEIHIAGFTGRIVRDGTRPAVIGCPQFGASKHIARIIIAAANRDPIIRSAMNIKFNDRNIDACERAGLTLASFSRNEEPRGVSSMGWGVGNAIEKYGSVPDAIWDSGGMGKEPMIRILGRDPDDVFDKIRRISETLRE